MAIHAGSVGCGECELVDSNGPFFVCARGWQTYAGPREYKENLLRGDACLKAEQKAAEYMAAKGVEHGGD